MKDFVVHFKLTQFNLVVGTKVFEAFTKRMKEKGYAHKQEFNGRVHYFWEGDFTKDEVFLQICKRTKVVGDDFVDYYEFQPNFYDKQEGGELFNILEAMCKEYKGTMIGTYYSGDRVWGVRIINGTPDFGAYEDIVCKERYDWPKLS